MGSLLVTVLFGEHLVFLFYVLEEALATLFLVYFFLSVVLKFLTQAVIIFLEPVDLVF